MVDLAIKQRTFDLSTISFRAFNYRANQVSILPFVKEDGGVGSTSAAMSVIELLISLEIGVHIVDLASKQLDLEVPYASVDGVKVHQQGIGESNEAAVLRAVMAAQPGEVVVVQFPASNIERIEALNVFLTHVLIATGAPVTASIIWTMDSDRCSADTLDLMLGSTLPGVLSVNWPTWNGPPTLAEATSRKVLAQGGTVFAIPALPEPYYGAFKRDRIAPATQYQRGDAAVRWELDFWRHQVWQAVGGVA